MEEDKKKKDGCVPIFIFVVMAGLLVFTLCTSSNEDLKQYGIFVNSIIVIVLGYFGFKALNRQYQDHPSDSESDDSENPKTSNSTKITAGCFFKGLALIAVLVLIFNALYFSSAAIGVILIVVVCVVLGLYWYSNSKD